MINSSLDSQNDIQDLTNLIFYDLEYVTAFDSEGHGCLGYERSKGGDDEREEAVEA